MKLQLPGGKISAHTFKEIIDAFKWDYKNSIYKGVERFVRICWSTPGKCFIQSYSDGRTFVENDRMLVHSILIAEFHSHRGMGPFFVDGDFEETAPYPPIYHGCIGMIHSDEPSVILKYRSKVGFVEVDLNDLVEKELIVE